MSKKNSFQEVKRTYFGQLEKFVPVVDRVHGGSHPEFHDVKRVWETINMKTKVAGNTKPDLTDEFKELREITNNYLVPSDVCETYEWVYNVLKIVDEAFNA